MLENIGIGIDIVDIKRFQEKPYETNHKFYEKIFLKSEIDHCLRKKNSSETFASKFAIKEAVIKSIEKQISFLEINTEYKNEKPIVSISNDKSLKFLVSVSHEKDFAIAMVIVEKIK